jgi:hypothetical protein
MITHLSLSRQHFILIFGFVNHYWNRKLRVIITIIEIVFDCLRTGTGGGLLWVRWWTFGFLRHGVSFRTIIDQIGLNSVGFCSERLHLRSSQNWSPKLRWSCKGCWNKACVTDVSERKDRLTDWHAQLSKNERCHFRNANEFVGQHGYWDVT